MWIRDGLLLILAVLLLILGGLLLIPGGLLIPRGLVLLPGGWVANACLSKSGRTSSTMSGWHNI